MDLAKWYYNNMNYDNVDYDILWTFNDANNIETCSKPDKNIYLTIDNVINNDSFEEILDVLDEFNAKATFFVISSLVNEQNINLLARAVKSGHHLANHGQTNCRHFLSSYSKLYNEITDCEKLIEKIYLKNNVQIPIIKYFRPGYGYVSSDIDKICKSIKYKIVLGSIYPQDTKLPFPNLIYYYIKSKVKPNDIIILHDRKFTPSVLKKTLRYLKNNDWSVKSLI